MTFYLENQNFNYFLSKPQNVDFKNQNIDFFWPNSKMLINIDPENPNYDLKKPKILTNFGLTLKF